jgi:hypothetical protein
MSTTIAPAAVTPKAPAVSPAAAWPSLGRAAAAFTLVAAGVLWAIADVIGFGVSDGLTYIGAHPTLSGIGIAADTLAVPFLIGCTAVWLLLSRHASPKLAWTGAILLVFGLIGQGMIEGVEMISYTVARSHKIGLATYENVTNSPAGIPGAVFMAMFFIGSSLGIVLAMIALWRSHAVPRVATLLPIAFQVAQTVGVPFPATILTLAGLAWMAVAILRTPSRSVAA